MTETGLDLRKITAEEINDLSYPHGTRLLASEIRQALSSKEAEIAEAGRVADHLRELLNSETREKLDHILRIHALEEQVKGMREALKPFAAGYPNTDKRDYLRAEAALSPSVPGLSGNGSYDARPSSPARSAGCYDCGLPYTDPGFADLVVSHDVWAKISPTGHEGGLLCPSCMVRAAEKAGVENVTATFRSGPFRAQEPQSDALRAQSKDGE